MTPDTSFPDYSSNPSLFIGWLKKAYHYTAQLPVGADKHLKILHEALQDCHQKQENW